MELSDKIEIHQMIYEEFHPKFSRKRNFRIRFKLNFMSTTFKYVNFDVLKIIQ